MVLCRHDIAAEIQPSLIIAGQPQHRPVTAENHAVATKEFKNGLGIRPHGFRSLFTALGQQTGEFAMDIGKSRQSGHILAPVAVVTDGNHGLRAMVDDDGQLRMAAGERQQMRQIGRQDQRIERQTVLYQSRRGWIECRIIDPGNILHALQHRTHSLEGRMFCPASNFTRRVGRLHVHPANHALDEIGLFRQFQHEIRVGPCLHRLHQHGAGNSGSGQQGRQIGGEKIPVDGGERRRRPLPGTILHQPEMLVGVDNHASSLPDRRRRTFGNQATPVQLGPEFIRDRLFEPFDIRSQLLRIART